jgi:hypothetical protein
MRDDFVPKESEVEYKYTYTSPTACDYSNLSWFMGSPVNVKETVMGLSAVEKKAQELVKAEAIAALLPYPKTQKDGGGDISTVCPKCGRNIYSQVYHSENTSSPERILWSCVCTYRFYTKTKDA